MMTKPDVPDLLRRSTRYLERHGVASARVTAEALLRHVASADRVSLYSGRVTLSVEARRNFGQALCRRAHGTPLEHITGERQFFDLSLRVRPGVFIPRAETEVLVEAALEVVRDRRAPVVLDVGTGTGAIALAVKRFRPDARVVATDASPAAAEAARENAHRLSLDVDVSLGDLFTAVPRDLLGRVDLIVSNPPYLDPDDFDSLPPEVRAEPLDALVGGTDVHRRLVDEAPAWLATDGWLVCEIGSGQGPEVAALFRTALVDVRVIRDLADRDRVVIGRRVAA